MYYLSFLRKHIDYDVIDKYCHFLKTKGIGCVFVDCDASELSCLTLDERKRLCEEWFKCCRKHGLLMIYTVGGCCLTDCYQLCEHADKLGVDCICVLADLCYRPYTEKDLSDYLVDICKHCPTRPVCYYHIPRRTHVRGKLENFNITCGSFHGKINLSKFFGIGSAHGTFL